MTTKKTALLIIDHGSRFDQANDMIDEVKAMLETLRPDLMIEVAHMELAKPDIRDGFERCVERGATEVVAHPYMLSPGRHASQDIPRMVQEVAADFPNIHVRVTKPLGVHPKIGEVVLEKAFLD